MAKTGASRKTSKDNTKKTKKPQSKQRKPDKKIAIETLSENPEPDPKPKNQKQSDLAWLIGRPDIVKQHQGNYVAIYREQVIAVAPCEKLVHQAIANKPDIDSEQTLIVPLNIAGGEYIWEELQATLDN